MTAAKAGSGYGYGYGYGSGSGSGYGDGSGSGYGDGSGDGYGSGSGSGYGDGYGSGYGSGDGYGSGSGSGYGDGYGSGSGYGDGSGSGYGDGYGDGYGYGYGSALAEAYAHHPLIPVGELAITIGFWRSDAKGLPANGGRSSEPARPGLLEEVPGPLRICTRNALHADTNPAQWSGERWWVVALLGPVQTQGTKMGALKRLILEELV